MKSTLILVLLVWIIYLGHKINELGARIEQQNTAFFQCINHGGGGFTLLAGTEIIGAALCIPVSEAGH